MIWWALALVVLVPFGLIVLRGAPYVPTHLRQLRRAFRELYPLSEHDRLVDLGSGDGIVLREARKCGAQAVGYELNPFLVAVTCWLSRGDPGVEVYIRDYLLLDRMPDGVTVVYAFTTSRNIAGIARKCEQWAAHQPITFISYGFEIPGRKADVSAGPMQLYRFGGKKSKR